MKNLVLFAVCFTVATSCSFVKENLKIISDIRSQFGWQSSNVSYTNNDVVITLSNPKETYPDNLMQHAKQMDMYLRANHSRIAKCNVRTYTFQKGMNTYSYEFSGETPLDSLPEGMKEFVESVNEYVTDSIAE